MNHSPHRFRPDGIEDRPLTRRAQAKLNTRDKVLQAAKRLFISRGYEAATIRDIAQEAGMSTGAVFANFTDKNDLFHAVMNNDIEAQMVLIGDTVNHPGPVDVALRELFSIGYEVQLAQLPLLQAAASLSWSQGLNGPRGERPQFGRVVGFLQDILRKAVERGELKADANTALVADMIWDAYQANYRLAVFEDWGLDRLNERFSEQLQVILAGVRAKA
jgi:AcrR family transcriptional regulator